MARKRKPLPGFDDLPPDALIHLTDTQPGFTRKGAGKGFYYLDAEGRKVDDPADLARINALALPPAYRNVWIAPVAHGHLQATGRDARNRKQYRYHPVWQTHRNHGKFDRLEAFGDLLPRLRRRLVRDIDRDDFSREMMLATVIRLMDLTGMRVGNRGYTRENESYGVTTLQQRHLELQGNAIQFEFDAKGGRHSTVALASQKLAQVLARCDELPGQALFQYRAGDERTGFTRVDSQHVNDYLKQICDADWVSAKLLRTWRGSVYAFEHLADSMPDDSASAVTRQIVAMVKATARHLRNRPATCRKYYIHPAIIDAFEAGAWPPPETPDDKPRELLQAEARFLHFLHRRP